MPRSFDRVCIVAMLYHRNGIARGAELQADAFRRIGIETELIDAKGAQRNPFYRAQHKPATAYILHGGGAQTAALLQAVLPAARKAYRIAYWAWEMTECPCDWPEELVSEIWTCSHYSKRSLAFGYRKPIHVVPHVVPTLAANDAKRPIFTVITFIDSRSSIERKNPAAAVKAFKLAFGGSTDAKLILKVNGYADEIRLRLGSLLDRNVEIVDKFLDEAELKALLRSCHVLMSLHRAEGFGLPMLEAMAAGIPVIATEWSGNLDFMTPSNSILIPATIVPVKDSGLYSSWRNSVWAEPDITSAAKALKTLKEQPAYAASLGESGFQTASKMALNWRPPGWRPLDDQAIFLPHSAKDSKI